MDVKRLWSRFVLLALLGTMPGCVSQEQRNADEGVASYYMGDYARAVQLIKPAAAKTNENFVLNNDRLGSAALAAYDLDTAEGAFVRSYEVINSVGVNDGGRSLGAALVSENIKVWKGEPFERAMVNFYLGVVYYMRHDYANARGAFENALFKLRDYGEGDHKGDQYHAVESNFVLGYLMLARCYQQLDRADLAQKNFERVVSLRPDLAALADASFNQQANVVLIIDFGRGPQKVANGDGAFVGFQPTPRQQGPIPLPAVTVDGRRIDLLNRNLPPVDLLALAQDRRWESIDTIRAVKSVLGTGLIAAGIADAALSRHPDPAVSLGLVAGGLLLKATSQGDLRQWEMLPRTVFVVPVHVEPGKRDITVEFPALPGYRQRWLGLDVPEKGDAAYYIHIDRYNPGPYQWPPPVRPAGAKEVS
jgi:tetratricopeptide (TPR) repeat protein